MPFFEDELRLDPDLAVIITNPRARDEAWEGVLLAPLSFDASADFGVTGLSTLTDRADALRESIAGFTGLVDNPATQMLSRAMSRRSFKTQKLSYKTWQGSADPVVTVQFGLGNLGENNDSSFKEYYDLQAQLYPELADEAGTYARPYGFEAGNAQTQSSGLWSVRVGRWFRADEMLLTNVAVAPSMTLDESFEDAAPSPIYTVVSATFTTPRAATRTSVRSWIRPATS